MPLDSALLPAGPTTQGEALPTTAAQAPAASPTPVVPEDAAPSSPDVLYEDSFADLAGAIQWNRNSVKSTDKGPNLRTIYFFAAKPEDGPLTMKVFEDHESKGPDEKPGVLSLSWEELPAKLPYSGFVLLGRRTQRMLLPPLTQAKTAEDLKKLKLTFSYKGLKKDPEMKPALTVGCRLEPMLADSYNKRLDFGNITATDKWNTFTISLGEGTNAEAFLKAIADENPGAFKLIWAQAGPLTGYHAGDTLLLDDLSVKTVETP
jgi:hypothetical protein